MVPRAVVWAAVALVCIVIGILQELYIGCFTGGHAGPPSGPWVSPGWALASVLVGGSIALTLAKLLPVIKVRHWLRPLVGSAVGATLAPLQAFALFWVLGVPIESIMASETEADFLPLDSLPGKVEQFVGGFLCGMLNWWFPFPFMITMPYGALLGVIMPYIRRPRAAGTSQP